VITEDKVREMARSVADRFRPEKVILFGSCARGEYGPDSDVDFLIVMSFEGSRREATVEILRHLNRFRVSLDVIVLTPEEFERKKDIAGTIAYPASREGRVLHAA